MAFVKVEDLIKIYNPDSKNSISALRGVKLEIEEGSFVTLLGPSGCGKSTLINLMALFDTPTAGKITIEGIDDIYKLKEKERITYHQETIGYMSQFTNHNLIPNWTVENNIKIPIKLKNKLTREQTDKRISDLLELVDLRDKRKISVGKLSGGEAQRISLITALANNPKLLLADEPTGELDSKNTILIGEILKEIVQEKGKTVLVVTHNSLLADKSEKSWLMQDGRITGLYKQTNKEKATTLQNKYFTYVDDHGNLRLPQEIIKLANIKEAVTIEYNKETKKVELTPE